MSIELMTAVWRTEIGPPVTRLVLLALADSANDEGVCWPSMSTVARKAGCGVSTARAAVTALQKDGYLRREERRTEGDRNQSNVFHLNVARLRQEGAAEIQRGYPQDPAGVPLKSSGSAAGIRRQNPKTNPKEHSVGATADAAAVNDDGDGLFPAPASSPGPEGLTAKDVAAAYVDAYRAAKGVEPVSGNVGKVGTMAKRLLSGGADPDVLVEAAAALAASRFTNLDTQYESLLTAKHAAAQQPDSSAESARRWVNTQWEAGTVAEICKRTGLYYQSPDLPLGITDPTDIAAFMADHRRAWIKSNRDTILDSLVRKGARS